MLKNAPTLAIVGVDTAENGPSKVRQVTNKIRRNKGYPSGDFSRSATSSTSLVRELWLGRTSDTRSVRAKLSWI